jgi:prepilin-type N-terminal cleavage/methylation domain-containing protein
MRSRELGFTLIEVLIVVVIILVLVALIFPAYSAAQERGRQGTCASNLKQLAMAMKLYANDWDGYLPNARVVEWGDGNPAVNWAGVYHVGGKCDPSLGLLHSYIKNLDVFRCPDQVDSDLKAITASDALPYPLSYAMNDVLSSKMLEHLSGSPNRIGLLLHEDPGTLDDGDFCWSGLVNGGAGQELPAKVHGGGTLVVYCDFHAKWSSYDDLIQELKNGGWNVNSQ